MGMAKRVALIRSQGAYIPKALVDFFTPWRPRMDDVETRRELALRRTDRMKFPGPSRPYPIAEQVARVPEDVLMLVGSTLATLVIYRNALRAAREAELDGIPGAGRNLIRRHGQSRLMDALPVLRHFVRQGRPWDIDPYAVLRHLMPRPPGPATVADSIEAVAEELDPVAPRLKGVTVADIATPDLEELPPVEIPPAPLVLDDRPEPPPDPRPGPMPPPPDGFAELVSPKRKEVERALADLMPLKTAWAIASGFAEGRLGAVAGVHESVGPAGDRRRVWVGTGRRGNRKVIQFGRLDDPTPASPDAPTSPDPGSPHGNDVPGAPDASETPEGPIYPPDPRDRSGATQRRPGRRARTMPGQGSLFD
jgi:hypothetical protein